MRLRYGTVTFLVQFLAKGEQTWSLEGQEAGTTLVRACRWRVTRQAELRESTRHEFL